MGVRLGGIVVAEIASDDEMAISEQMSLFWLEYLFCFYWTKVTHTGCEGLGAFGRVTMRGVIVVEMASDD